MTELAPRQTAACDAGGFAALSPALSPEVASWTRELRTIWTAAGVSINRFAGRYPVDKGTLSRYLNGKRVPRDHWFLNTLLAIQAEQGKEVSQEVRDHLTELHLEALKVAHPHEYRVRVVSDELELALVGQHEAERYARALQEQLAERVRQIEELIDQNGQLRAAWDVDRTTMAAEKDRLRREIAVLERRLRQAQERTAQTERRCRHLEDLLNHLQEGFSGDSGEFSDGDSGPGGPAGSVSDLPLTDPVSLAEMLGALRKVDARPQALALAARAVAEVSVTTDPGDAAKLLEELRELGARDAARTWAERAVPAVLVTAPSEVARLLEELRLGAAQDLALVLARRVVAEAGGTADPGAVAKLLEQLRQLGAREPARTLAESAVWRVDVDDAWNVSRMLGELRKLDQSSAFVLAERAVPEVNATNAYNVSQMLAELRMLQKQGLARALAERAVLAVDVTNGFNITQILQEMRRVDPRLALALAERAVPAVNATNALNMTLMLGELRALGARHQARVLAKRTVQVVDLTTGMAELLVELRRMGAQDLARALTERRIPRAPMLSAPRGARPTTSP
ncbi:hypothetical protein E1287_13715 [Actinomadura sp. KC06]|uniref:hypothetical protein n=1 Tax=Actinomadura sp. KC06 TaxID=2530369 RepID=UPI00104B735F|nr:hypothetical protein [Actinomadura sp. KC06]TDD35531.1 hypothetical protein E1287_13715 [Actinomadura sp. KC06]